MRRISLAAESVDERDVGIRPEHAVFGDFEGTPLTADEEIQARVDAEKAKR
jgi:hypothetical protein